MLRAYATNRLDAGGGSVVINSDGTVTVTGETDLSADLVLVSGAALKWDSSDVTLTHASNTLTLAGGTLVAVGVTTTGAVTNSLTTAITNAAEGNTGAVTLKTTRQVVAMGSGATAVSTSISVPSGARLIGAALNVDVAVTNDGNNTWKADFSTGSTTAIAVGGTAAAKDTKVSILFDDEVTTGIAEITFTPQAANFTAGSIECVVWYEQITALASA
ncbi:hypothetical protein LCGC14_2103270 [marine sediment metagenome]|uniref:Uncharacterized protein n=1 Tax=marine sediment metagenome TaxID=412755 RepID=A0A0F9H5P5_9ZZZZ